MAWLESCNSLASAVPCRLWLLSCWKKILRMGS